MRGHVVQRASRRGGYLYYVVVPVDGKQRWIKPPGPSTKRNAEIYLSQVVNEINTGTFSPTKEITFEDFVDIFWEKYVLELAPNSQKIYESYLRYYLIPAFSKRDLASIGMEDVQGLKTELLQKLSAQSVKNILTLMKVVFNRAIDWDYLRDNPVKKIRNPKVPKKQVDFLKPDEVRLLLNNAPDHQWKTFFLVAVVTGMRIGELLAMKWSNVDWINSRYHVRENVLYSHPFKLRLERTKTAFSSNPVDLSPSCLEALKIHRENQDQERQGDKYESQDLIFATPTGGLIHRTNFERRIFRPTLERSGLRRIRIHDLRHTCTALLLHQGESIKYIQRQLRHATIQVTLDTYGHLFDDVHREAAERLDRTLFGGA